MNPIQIPWKTHYYHRNRLDTRDRAIYDYIFDGLQNWKEKIPVPPGRDIDEIYEIFSLVIRDCPLFFHVDLEMRMISGWDSYILLRYRMSSQEYDVLYKQVCDFVKRSTVHLRGVQRIYDKVRSIHNSMVSHVIYFGKEEDDSHNVIGAILKRKAVCESIAKAFKLICDANYIPCIVVFGRSLSTDGKNYGTVSENDGKINHAWNMVKIGESWYNIDVTFDLSIANFTENGLIRYDYFCRSDRVFRMDHIPMCKNLPVAKYDHSYYKDNGLYVTDVKSTEQLIRKMVKDQKMHIAFEYDPFCFSSEEIRNVAFREITSAYCKTIYTASSPVLPIIGIHLTK